MNDKVTKALGRDTVEEMDAMTTEELKKVVVEASSAMKEVKEELEANQNYQSLKADLKDLTAGKAAVDKRQKARIAYALDRVDSLGNLDPLGMSEFLKQRAEFLTKQAKQAKQALEEAEDYEQEEANSET